MQAVRCATSERGFTLIELGVAIAIIGVLSMITGQTARLNVLFLPAVQKVPAQCALNLQMFDQDGTMVASASETLAPNESKSLTLPAGTMADEIHAVVGVPRCPNNAPACSMDQQHQQAMCLKLRHSFHSSLEIMDVATGKVQVALPAVQ